MIAAKNIFITSETAFAVDRTGQILVWNQAAEKTFGYAEYEALGQQCWKLLSGLDVFGNQSCCVGCPIRDAAFNSEPINRFKADFMTAEHKRKRYIVCTLMFFNARGKDVFVHIFRPEPDVDERTVTNRVTHHSAVENQRKTLTPRETEVLAHLHKGMTIPGIAAELNICPATVRNHTQHVLLKLHVHSRFEAVALGRDLGLI